MKFIIAITFILVGCTSQKPKEAVKKKETLTAEQKEIFKNWKQLTKDQCKKLPESMQKNCLVEVEQRKNALPVAPIKRRAIIHRCQMKTGAVFPGCQGELCFCGKTPTKLPQATQEAEVKEFPWITAKVIHTLKKGDSIKKGEPHLQVLNFGQGKIEKPQANLKIQNSKKAYTNGDLVILVHYSGEGYWAFCEDSSDQPLFSDYIKPIVKPKVDDWLKVTLMDDRTGWVKGRPFNYQQESCG